jgi:hypothetical protein
VPDESEDINIRSDKNYKRLFMGDNLTKGWEWEKTWINKRIYKDSKTLTISKNKVQYIILRVLQIVILGLVQDLQFTCPKNFNIGHNSYL